MTTAERLINQGREEGMEKGIEKGLVKTALNMFRKGLDLDTVSEYIALPLEQLKGLQHQASH